MGKKKRRSKRDKKQNNIKLVQEDNRNPAEESEPAVADESIPESTASDESVITESETTRHIDIIEEETGIKEEPGESQENEYPDTTGHDSEVMDSHEREPELIAIPAEEIPPEETIEKTEETEDPEERETAMDSLEIPGNAETHKTTPSRQIDIPEKDLWESLSQMDVIEEDPPAVEERTYDSYHDPEVEPYKKDETEKESETKAPDTEQAVRDLREEGLKERDTSEIILAERVKFGKEETNSSLFALSGVLDFSNSGGSGADREKTKIASEGGKEKMAEKTQKVSTAKGGLQLAIDGKGGLGGFSADNKLQDDVFSRLEVLDETENQTPDTDSAEIEIPEIPVDDEIPKISESAPNKNQETDKDEFASEIIDIKDQMTALMNRLQNLEQTGAVISGPKAENRKEEKNEKTELKVSPEEKIAIKSEVEFMLQGLKNISLEKEIRIFGNLIQNHQSLHFLKPRYAEIISREQLDYPVLVGLYRIASRILEDELKKSQESLELNRREITKLKNNAKLLEGLVGPTEKTVIVEVEKKEDPSKLKPILTEKEHYNLRQEINNKQKEIDEMEFRLARMKADFTNFRTRQQKEIDRQINLSTEDLFINLLPVVDNFDRALDSSKSTDNIESIIKGFQLIHEDFQNILKKYNIQEVPALKEHFDPHYHEALMREEVDDHPDGVILQVLRKGYMLSEKLLRPSQVKTACNPKWVVEPEKKKKQELGEGIEIEVTDDP